jgi:DNA-binding transcriptional regulator YiaG
LENLSKFLFTAPCRSEIGAIQFAGRSSVKLRFWSMTKLQNIVGPQIRKLRYQQELTQEMFAARCSILGWDLSRGTLSKIEAQLRCVTDAELVVLAKALKVEVHALLPPKKARSR